MAFELEQLLEDVTTRNAAEVEALLARREADSKKVAEFREILQKSTDAHRDAMKRVLDEKLKLAQDYVEKHIYTLPEPQEYDLDRINELRALIATGSDATVEARCEKMAALRELQSFLMKFPFIDRVADLVRKATGCTDVVVQGEGPCERRLLINGSVRMSSTTRSYEYYDRNSEPYQKASMGNIHVPGNDSVCIVNFWEIYVIMQPINFRYIVGADECGKWGDNVGDIRDYPKILHNLCVSNGRIERNHRLLEDLSDKAFVPLVVLNTMDRLTVNQCLQSVASMSRLCANAIKQSFACKLQTIFKDALADEEARFHFDTEQREFKWEYKRNVDKSLQFDPDTCELMQPEIGWNTTPVGDVVIRDLHDYVARNTPWIKPYGKIEVRVRCKEGIDLVAEWKKRGDGLLTLYGESCYSIVSIDKTDIEGLYTMVVSLRVPLAEAFRTGTKCSDGGYTLRCEKDRWTDVITIF